MASTGIFVTIWRRYGEWRIAFDIGIPDPPLPAACRIDPITVVSRTSQWNHDAGPDHE